MFVRKDAARTMVCWFTWLRLIACFLRSTRIARLQTVQSVVSFVTSRSAFWVVFAQLSLNLKPRSPLRSNAAIVWFFTRPFYDTHSFLSLLVVLFLLFVHLGNHARPARQCSCVYSFFFSLCLFLLFSSHAAIVMGRIMAFGSE